MSLRFMVLSIHVLYKPESVNIKALTVWSLILVISFTRSLTKDSLYYLHCYHALANDAFLLAEGCVLMYAEHPLS